MKISASLKLIGKVLLFLVIAGLLVTTSFAYAKGWLKIYEKKIVNDQPLILKNNDVLTIWNTRYIQKNNIILQDNARLIVIDSLFEHRQDFASQYTLEARDRAQVVLKNSQIRSSAWLNWNFFDSARLEMENVEQTFSDIWHSFQGQASALIQQAKFHGTINDDVSFEIEDSPETFIEFVYPPGAIVDEELPRHITDYTFPNAGEKNISSHLKMKNSTASSWGITVTPQSSVTIKNTDSLIVTFAIGEPWKGITAELNDLKAQRYFNQTWQVVDASLRLQNVTTGRWSPIVGGTNTLIIKNSELSDNAFSWGQAQLVIENSTASFLKAKDSVEMTVKDSVVSGDIVATENGRITLINTNVKGKIIEEGNGKVIQRNDQ